MRIILGQLNFIVGSITENKNKIIAAIDKARDELKGDLIIFPELALTGYPLEDLLHRQHLHQLTNIAIKEIIEHTTGIDVVVGLPEEAQHSSYNTAMWIREQKVITTYHKHKLPNYSVFDEERYFKKGEKTQIVNCKGINFGLLICEDIWHPEPIQQAKAAGAECILTLNGSPFSIEKASLRKEILTDRINEAGLPICYVNLIGGQDELIFDGGSFTMNSNGTIANQADYFCEQLLAVKFDEKIRQFVPESLPKELSFEERIYGALKLGVRDYVQKNGFKKVILGLSGGLDSALTLTIAVDVLGAENVSAVYMPARYSSQLSEKLSKQQAALLGIELLEIPIDDLFSNFLNHLQPYFKGLPQDTTEENIQARIRGTILMSLSNKFNKLVLSTGNKSELSVGYSTLYGDMVGGFCVLKDVMKTTIYKLAHYRNTINHIIPEEIISRAPSAELRADQVDQDTLPPYDILDAILEQFIEKDLSVEDIIKSGYDPELVKRTTRMVLKSEYKRRQSPPGIRITVKAFGRDRRYPITSRYLIEE